jgi:phosphate transport system permease protein
LILSLLIGGLPAFRQFGIGFIASTGWDPVQQVFGAAVSIYGTLMTSVLALILAVPPAFGIAYYVTELAPTWLRRPVGTAVELLAAVPSIIYGMWGCFVIVPLLSQYVQPFVIDALDGIPVLQDLSQPMSSLPVTIYQYAGSAFEDWVQLAWVGALLITVGVLTTNVLARFALRGGR